MGISDWLKNSTNLLKDAGVQTARLDCLVLLSDELGHDKAWILAHEDEKLPPNIHRRLDKCVEERSNHIPLAYIRGKSDFYGREFTVNEHTLVPRPETEAMMDMLINETASMRDDEGFTIVDVGTGSGCLIVSAYLEINARRPKLKAKFLATDISKAALKIAKKNADKHGANIEFYYGNLLEPVISWLVTSGSRLIILANLPYVPNNYELNKSAQKEPGLAIFGGESGLELYEELFMQITKNDIPCSVYAEALDKQQKDLESLAIKYNFKETTKVGLAQVFVPVA